jgi:GNAT superfamily N-acetyltransferase
LRGARAASELDTEPRRVDLDLLHRWLSEDAYRALGRSRDAVERSIQGSRVAAAFDGPHMIGFARAVTDNATIAWLCDVYVARSARGRGVGTWMVDAFVRASGIPRLVLATRDPHGLYRRFGFRELVEPSRWMERRGPGPRTAGLPQGR